MIKYRQLCFWIVVATATTAFGQTSPGQPAAAARDPKVTQQPVAAEAAPATPTDPTTPKNRPSNPKSDASPPATAATPVKAKTPVPATTSAEAAQPGAEPGAKPKLPGTLRSGRNQVAAPAIERRTTSRIAIIELDAQTAKSDVIRQVVKALEKQGIARSAGQLDSVHQGEGGLTARIAARADTNVNDLQSLIRSLQGHNVQRISFTKPTDDRNVVTVLAPADTPWPAIDNLRIMVTAKKQFAVDVQIAPSAPAKYNDPGSRSSYGNPLTGTAGNTRTGRPAKRTESVRTTVNMIGKNGQPMSQVEKSADAIEKVLKETDGITVMMGVRNVLLPLLHSADVSKVAQAILRSIRSDDEMMLLADVDGLVIRTPQKDFKNPSLVDGGNIVQAIIQAQSGGESATTTDGFFNRTNSNPLTQSKKKSIPETRVFMLRFADAKVVAQTLSELFSEGFGIAPDVNINALIVRGDGSQLKEVEAIVELVDGQSGKKKAFAGGLPMLGGVGSKSTIRNQKQKLTVDVDVPPVPAAQVRSQIADLDVRIKETADSLRSAEPSSDQNTEDKAKRKAELREVVRKTFLARQELQRAELAEFAARLDRIQQSIAMRDRIADQIIDRRVEELIDPNVKSGSESVSTQNIQVNRSKSMTEQPQPKQAQSTTIRNTEIVESRSTNGAMILRSADEFRKLLAKSAAVVAERKASFEAWKADPDASRKGIGEEDIKRQEKLLAAAESDQKFAEKEYRTQIQLLESELETVNLMVETAEQELLRTKELVKVKAAPRHKLDERNRELAAAIHRLDRAKVLLSLYHDAAKGI